jgi:hypothetical protein
MIILFEIFGGFASGWHNVRYPCYSGFTLSKGNTGVAYT